MDRQEHLISLFSYIDRRYESELFIFPERMSGSSYPELSDVDFPLMRLVFIG